MEGTLKKIRDVYVKPSTINSDQLFKYYYSKNYFLNYLSSYFRNLLAELFICIQSKSSCMIVQFFVIKNIDFLIFFWHSGSQKKKKERKEMKFPTSFCIPWISHSSYLTLYTIMKLWFLMHNHTPPSLEEWKRISERWNVETRDGRVCVFFKFSFGI